MTHPNTTQYGNRERPPALTSSPNSDGPIQQIRKENRGQTALDFLFGITFFLGAVAILLAMTGGFFVGGVLDEADRTPEATHILNHLTDDELAAANATTASQLDHNRTVAFFDDGQPPSVADLPADSELKIRVTLTPYGSDKPPRAFNGASSLSTGDTPDNDIISEASTTATLEGSTVRLTVETWT